MTVNVQVSGGQGDYGATRDVLNRSHPGLAAAGAEARSGRGRKEAAEQCVADYTVKTVLGQHCQSDTGKTDQHSGSRLSHTGRVSRGIPPWKSTMLER